MQCTAKSKQSGEQCKRPAVQGMKVCNIHGGKSLSGMASPTFVTGRYSKHLPTRLVSRFEQSLEDTTLLELKAEIALADSRLEDLLQRVDTGEAGNTWNKLKSLAIEAKINPDKSAGHTAVILKTILDTQNDYDAWNEIHTLVEHRRKLVESERKRIIEAQQFVTAEQAMILIGAILSVIKEHVSDRNTLQSISQGINRLIARDAG